MNQLHTNTVLGVSGDAQKRPKI